MLLEQLVEKSRQPPQYDWDAYYRWLFGRLAGQEGGEVAFWFCSRCFTVNAFLLPARYGKCRRCDLIHISRNPAAAAPVHGRPRRSPDGPNTRAPS